MHKPSRSANCSPVRAVHIDLSDAQSEDTINIKFNEKIRKPALLTFKQIGLSSDQQRKREMESDAAREIRLVLEAKEAEMNAYKEKVFIEHDETSAASTRSSQMASRCSR